MQKVEGSSPFIRFQKPGNPGLFVWAGGANPRTLPRPHLAVHDPARELPPHHHRATVVACRAKNHRGVLSVIALRGGRQVAVALARGEIGLVSAHGPPIWWTPRHAGSGSYRRSSARKRAASCADASISTLRIETLSTLSPKGTPTRRQNAMRSTAVATA